jgi:hypothetical protein
MECGGDVVLTDYWGGGESELGLHRMHGMAFGKGIGNGQ